MSINHPLGGPGMSVSLGFQVQEPNSSMTVQHHLLKSDCFNWLDGSWFDGSSLVAMVDIDLQATEEKNHHSDKNSALWQCFRKDPSWTSMGFPNKTITFNAWCWRWRWHARWCTWRFLAFDAAQLARWHAAGKGWKAKEGGSPETPKHLLTYSFPSISARSRKPLNATQKVRVGLEHR